MSYKILPFRFERFSETDCILTNIVGEFLFLPLDNFCNFIRGTLNEESEIFLELKSKQIIASEEYVEQVVEMLAIKLRTKKSNLNDFTSLHMIVPTLRCNINCIYCQVSRRNLTENGFDMSKRTAKKTVEMIFESPSPVIKIEFQGGEPLTNFQMVKYIIEEAEWVNLFKKRKLEFVLCTNLSLITLEILHYLKKHNCFISTSLDGPNNLHNAQRILKQEGGSHAAVEEKLKLSRAILGEDHVSALMTTTSYSLGRFKEIIDEYVRLGFKTIFLRSLNPYGFAKKNKNKVSYPMTAFIENYKKALDYIIELNINGIFLIEGFSQLLLTRILTPFATGFVDLQSPAGVGISGAIYDYNGNVYVSDEARMLAATNDQYFLMGNVNENTYKEMFDGTLIHSIISSSCTESLPGCAECVYQPFCGADPVRNYSEQGDVVGHRPTNDTCQKTKAIIRFLFSLLKKNDSRINRVFWSWITKRDLNNNTIQQ